MRYTEIKQALIEAEIIDEVSMSPTSLEKFANSPEAEGMLIGVEFELCVPNANVDNDSGEGEYDYDMDERANDIDDIIRFFQEGEMSNLGASGADRLRSEMWDQFLDWQSEQISDNIDTDELNDRIRDRLDSDIDFDDMMELAKEQWQENNPDENPEDKASEDEIHQLALKLNEKTLDDMMEDTDSREYQRAYDDVRQEMEDEMRDDYDQSDWLSSLGISYMSEAEREWGLDWPHWTYYSSGGEADVDQVAEDFSDYTGFRAKGYNNYHSASRSDQQQQGYFIIEPDGSIDADQGDAGLEFISPAMPLKDGLAMIKKVKDWASAAGCYTNKSTGLHMNISVPNMTIDNLDYVKLALFLGDEHVLREFDRTYNSYAKSAMKVVKEKIEQNPENATALLAKMKEHVNAAASKLVHSGITNKYTSINTKDKYVEFRGPGGNYLEQDIPKLLNTALRAAQALRIATDDGAYKQEYAKKLYKLIGPEGEWTDPNNSVALFSRYALGQINKSELVSNVRQAQVARKEKKGEEQQYWVMNKDGTGGKQMVHATSPTEAIIKGGKQMGMKREASISKLKAEPFERLAPGPAPTKPAPETLTGGWKDWIENKAPKAEVNELLRFERELKAGQFSYLDEVSTEYLLDYINELIEFRKQDDNELDRRQNSTVDNNETRWKVEHRSGNGHFIVDADTPRQAKIKAQEKFLSVLHNRVDVDDLIATAIGTNNNAGAVHAIPQSWRDWVDTIINRRTDEITEKRQQIEQGTYNSVLGSQQQRDAVIGVIDDELRRRQDTGETGEEQSWIVLDGFNRPVGTVSATTRDEALHIYGSVNNVETRNYTAVPGAGNTTTTTSSNTDLAQAAGSAENAVRASLPTAHREWLENIADHSDISLINVLNNMNTTTVLNEQQAAYFRVTIKHELRRRGINPDEATPSPTTTYADERERMRQEREQISQDMAATQQGVDPDHQEWEIYNPSTGEVVSRVSQGDITYAVRKAREHEQDLGLSLGDLDIRPINQTNESISLIRRLAGLK